MMIKLKMDIYIHNYSHIIQHQFFFFSISSTSPNVVVVVLEQIQVRYIISDPKYKENASLKLFAIKLPFFFVYQKHHKIIES